MRILVSNDDGIAAAGIRALAQAMTTLGEVWVVAPDRQRSASSHGISLNTGITVETYDFGIPGVHAYSVGGTPVDCVKWAVSELGRSDRFDLMVSGINEGPNLATDVLYSGTVAAAGEAGLQGIRAFAFSLVGPTYPYAEAAEVAVRICRTFLSMSMPPDTFLSVNLPPSGLAKAPWRVTRLGVRGFRDVFKIVYEENGRRQFRYHGEELIELEKEDTDIAALRRGEISITPLRYHFTNDEMVDSLRVTWTQA